MKKVLILALVAVAAMLLGNQSASAFPPFKKGFDEMYMQPGTKLFEAYEGKSSCNVCHKGKSKKDRNAYGMALSKLLEKGASPEEIMDALKKVSAMKSAGEDSPTFGELIEEGKLPKE